MTAQQDKGFELAFDPVSRILWVRGWGAWDLEFAKKYQHAFREKTDLLNKSPQHWQAQFDFNAVVPNSEEIRRILISS